MHEKTYMMVPTHDKVARKKASSAVVSKHLYSQSLNALRGVSNEGTLIDFLYKKIQTLEAERAQNIRHLADAQKILHAHTLTSQMCDFKQQIFERDAIIKQLESDVGNLKDSLLCSQETNVKLAEKYDECRLELTECKRKMRQLTVLVSPQLRAECTYVQPLTRSGADNTAKKGIETKKTNIERKNVSIKKETINMKSVDSANKSYQNQKMTEEKNIQNTYDNENEQIRICYLTCDESETLRHKICILESQMTRMRRYCECLEARILAKSVFDNIKTTKLSDDDMNCLHKALEDRIYHITAELETSKQNCTAWKQNFDMLQISVAKKQAL